MSMPHKPKMTRECTYFPAIHTRGKQANEFPSRRTNQRPAFAFFVV
jgi:hypothetical protein